jgi:D-alanyl-D-alanine carboxypeptidase (penicillin-binding protein 5/6)
MTTRARDLGLSRSTFTNAWGRDDPEQKVTAREMALLAAHLIATFPGPYKYFGEREFTWNRIRQTNRNPLLAMDLGADGLKTGNIDASGYGLVASAAQNGQRLVLALYGASSARERAEEARKILQWGFRSFETKLVFKPGEAVGTAKIYGGASESVDLVAPGAIKLLVPRDSSERLIGHIVYSGPLIAPVAADRPVAHLKISRGGLEVLDVPLKTAAEVPVGSLPHRAMDAGLEYVGGLFRSYVARR